MTRDEVLALAREAGINVCNVTWGNGTHGYQVRGETQGGASWTQIERFAAACLARR